MTDRPEGEGGGCTGEEDVRMCMDEWVKEERGYVRVGDG